MLPKIGGMLRVQCLDLIKRNQHEVDLEKKAFEKWQKTKRQEVERISKAVRLCSKPSPPEPPSVSLSASEDPTMILA